MFFQDIFVFTFIPQFILLCSLLQEGKSWQIQSLREKDICIGMQPSPVRTSQSGLGYSSLSPICIPSSPTLPINPSFAVPTGLTPEYSPSSPIYTSSSPSASFTVPTCPRTEFAPSGLDLPAPDHTLSTLRNRNVLAAVLPETPTTTSTQTVEHYPLKEELSALLELQSVSQSGHDTNCYTCKLHTRFFETFIIFFRKLSLFSFKMISNV